MNPSFEWLTAAAPEADRLRRLLTTCWLLLHLRNTKWPRFLWSQPLWHLKTRHEKRHWRGLSPGRIPPQLLSLPAWRCLRKREDLCTLFWLPLLTPPASPLMRKMVLEYHFDHFILLLSAALILVSVQSVGPNPLMNVFFWGFTWQHIPTSGQWTAGWLPHRVFYFIPHCQMFMFAKRSLSAYISEMTAEPGMNGDAHWRLCTPKQKERALLLEGQHSDNTFISTLWLRRCLALLLKKCRSVDAGWENHQWTPLNDTFKTFFNMKCQFLLSLSVQTLGKSIITKLRYQF